jgi:DNA primase
VIVEGPLDAVAVTAAGGRYAGVAPCGTALTAEHLAALDAVVDLSAAGVTVAFDGDEAGRHAAVRAYHLLIGFSTEVAVVVLPPGQDPAQVVERQGPDGLAAVLGDRIRPLADWVVDAELDKWSRWLRYAEGQINALHAVAPVIAAMPAAHVARQVGRVADRLDLSHTIVTEVVCDALPDVIAHTSGSRKLRGAPAHAPHSAQQDFPAGAREPAAQLAVPASPPPRPGRVPQRPLTSRRIPG